MNIETLSIFADIIERGSMTKTAEKLHLSQSALTQQIKNLERTLDVQLLERSNKGVTPTLEGELLYKAAVEICEIYNALQTELTLQKQRKSIVRIAATNLVYTYALPCTLFDIKKHFPEINISIDLLPSEQIEEKVAAGKTDIGLLLKPSHHKNLYQKLLFSDRVCLVGNPEVYAKKFTKLSQLYEVPLLMLEQEHRSQKLLNYHLQSMGIEIQSLHILHTFDSIEAMKQSAINGYGLTFLPYSAVKKDLYSKHLYTIDFKDLDFEIAYYLITSSNISKNDEISKVAKYIEKTLQNTMC